MKPQQRIGPFEQMGRTMTCCQALVIAGVLALPMADALSYQDSNRGAAVDAGDSIQAEVKGRFGKAAGTTGEHTGFQIAANGLTWEVDVSGDPDLSKAAERLDGKPAIVTGTYAERRSAPRTRRILTARALEAAPAGDRRREYIDVTMRGTVQTGMMAIGGETTGATIAAGPVTWELALNDRQQEVARKLSGRKAIVSGDVRQVAGVEIGSRVIVRVRNIEPG